MSEQPNSRTPWGLIISIAVNGLLVGLLAGVLLAGGPRGQGGPPGPPPSPVGGPDNIDRGLARAILQAAPAAERRDIRRELGDAWRSTETDRRAIRDAQRAIARMVAADTFDRAAMSAAFKDWRDADARVKGVVQEALVMALDRLPPESREALAEEMKRRDARRGKRGERMRERLRDRPPPPPRD